MKYETMKERMKRLEQTMTREEFFGLKEAEAIKKDKWLGCCYESELKSFYGKHYE